MHKCILLVYCTVIVVVQHTITTNFDLLPTRLDLGDTESKGSTGQFPHGSKMYEGPNYGHIEEHQKASRKKEKKILML